MRSRPRGAQSRPVRAVLFDLDHTLFDTARSERRALARVAREVRVPFSARALALYQEVNSFVWAEYRAGRMTSEKLRVQRFHLWLERLRRDPGPAPRLAPLYLDEFSSRAELISGARRALQHAARAGHRLGVVTNGIDRVQRRRLRAGALTDVFSTIVTSERAGFTKPDPRIMELALRRLRCAPEQALYVGDDHHVDGLAATRSGVPFVWFNPARAPRPEDAGVVVHHEIASLLELRALLARD